MQNELEISAEVTAGLPHLSIYTLSEDWMLAQALYLHWQLIARGLGKPPSQWFDTKGERMYAAVVYLQTWFDHSAPVGEDDVVTCKSELEALRKPHSLCKTTFYVNGTARASVTMISSMVKRDIAGSNKKLSKVRDLWLTKDFNDARLEAHFERHHEIKSLSIADGVVSHSTANRLRDFNAADLFYFKNFVRVAAAAEWACNPPEATYLNTVRDCWFFGNVDDGDTIVTTVTAKGDSVKTAHKSDSGKLLFVCHSSRQMVDIPVR
ncbi:MAG: hypothetical protein GY947_05060 [Rhodobacteraceae bacterium]|nr:hypothetical protein [Paracoccaceae bacterium]